ncbi:hypothetical protein TSTA_091390 [Talaromyces stipitatus ATCC 10500]|uniref:Protein kinase domain-containing protein n=1 Tax=Talaromyces stipitatus (strain ATCC 10500 / CBS 375.48 / QM 6759 / NRRL 1006) TaxID=441959 RepID=B8M2I7_TALSN|nr:uncharacterized protein TSTA_091390 [Talaromyces stipitatus ATCC 10500]EED21898.1 hypothetical protein TSTA_091390 [Talaromyces stipitatus ATCC 10500]
MLKNSSTALSSTQKSRSLEDTIPFLEENERENFLSFVGQIVTWLPEKRQTARELMDHPFLKLEGR